MLTTLEKSSALISTQYTFGSKPLISSMKKATRSDSNPSFIVLKLLLPVKPKKPSFPNISIGTGPLEKEMNWLKSAVTSEQSNSY